MPIEHRRTLVHTLLYGVVSAAMYLMLYLYHEPILVASKQGGWNFVLPIGIAFAFSLVHGNFTGYFWDLLGVKAKTTKK